MTNDLPDIVQSEVQRRKAAVRWSGPELLRQRRWEKALAAAHRCRKRDASHLGALEVEAQALIALGRVEPAMSTLRQLIRMNPHEPAYELWRGYALQTAGRHHEALLALGRAYRMCKEGPLKRILIQEMDLLIHFLDAGTRDPQLIWAELGIVPPPRTAARDTSSVTVH